MLTAGGRTFPRRGLLILAALLVFAIPGGVLADYHDSPEVTQQRAIFAVTVPPNAPFHAHQSMLLFTPGAQAALHRHGGPGFITILSGELTLYEDGVENRYVAGDSLVEVPESLYKGGNNTDADTVLMVTYLVPEGEEVTTFVDDPDAPNPPEITATTLGQAMYMFADPPQSFDLIHTVSMFDPGAMLPSTVSAGAALLTSVSGTVTVEIGREAQELVAGEHLVIGSGQEYRIINDSDSDAVTMSTKLMAHEGTVLPQTGSTPYRAEPVMWLMFMTAMSLLVIGASLRFGWARV